VSIREQTVRLRRKKLTEHSPVTSEGLAEVEDTSFRGVVGRLKKKVKSDQVENCRKRNLRTHLIEGNVDDVSGD